MLKVPVDNTSDQDYTVKKGERLFQIASPDLRSFNIVLTETLTESQRGTQGFGSSGK
jgi:dUTPase